MSGFQEILRFILDGEDVKAGVANRAPRVNDQNIRYVRDLVEAALLGQAIKFLCVTVETETQIGMPVYWNPSTQRFERGLAGTETEPTTGAIITSPSSLIWGVVTKKYQPGNKADITLFGIVKDFDFSNALENDDEPEAGLYYLSGQSAGFVTRQRPPVSVPVFHYDGFGTAYVNPQIKDFLNDHVHHKFDLAAKPAGGHTPPAYGEKHTITNPDPNETGWLPADHASFDGKAPDGAAFGYNIAAEPQLDNLWPPLPVESATLEMLHDSVLDDVKGVHVDAVLDFPSIAPNSFEELTVSVEEAVTDDTVTLSPMGGPVGDGVIQGWVSSAGTVTVRYTNPTGGAIDPLSQTYHITVLKDPLGPDAVEGTFRGFERASYEKVIINRDGIWWMTDCYNEVPWPADLDTTSSISESVSSDDCPTSLEMQIVLWFTRVSFATDRTVVTSLQSLDERLIIRCLLDGSPGSTGDLTIDLDLLLGIENLDTEGHVVFKELLPEGKFNLGPVVEGVFAGNSRVAISSTDPLDVDGSTLHRGRLTVQAFTQPTLEVDVKLVRLDNATEEIFKDVPFIGLGEDKTSQYIAKLKVPDDLDIVSPKLSFRFQILGKVIGTFPDLTLTARTIPRADGSQLALPTTSSAVGLTTSTAITAANNYIEAESDQIDVVAGDIVIFELTRASGDAYAGQMGILDQVGILASGS